MSSQAIARSSRSSDLHVEFDTYGGIVKAVRGASFAVRAGKTLAIVGESGCGKSVTVQSIMGLIPMPPGRITRGAALLDGVDIIQPEDRSRQDVRGNRIGMIFQDPMSSLNPTMTIGDQIAETLQVHRGYSQSKALERAVELLASSHIPEPEERARQYPFAFSGGMLQRAMIAMAIACEPDILIADEPTTALDVTIQAQILDLLAELQRKNGMAIVLITHDLGGRRAHGRRCGRHVRRRDRRERTRRRYFLPLRAPVHAGTARGDAEQRDGENAKDCGRSKARRPISSIRRSGAAISRAARTRCGSAGRTIRRASMSVQGTNRAAGCSTPEAVAIAPEVYPRRNGMSALVEAKSVHQALPDRARQIVHAVDDVSLSIAEREIVGLVGESGSGKSTFGKTLVGLHDKTAGEVYFGGETLPQRYNASDFQRYASRMQMIFQDPYSSLNPRMTVGEIIGEGLRLNSDRSGADIRAEVGDWLARVGLERGHASRYPHEFSGGQRQRVGIARALIMQPKFVVCDEPISALDVSVQAQIVRLLGDLKESIGLDAAVHRARPLDGPLRLRSHGRDVPGISSWRSVRPTRCISDRSIRTRRCSSHRTRSQIRAPSASARRCRSRAKSPRRSMSRRAAGLRSAART